MVPITSGAVWPSRIAWTWPVLEIEMSVASPGIVIWGRIW